MAIPEGKTWLDTLRKSFVDVSIDPNDQGVDTAEFLDAAESTTTLFDLLGSAAFTPVKSDMTTNINKVRERLLAAPGESATLQSLVKSELATKKHKATEGLLWLIRGLDFTAQALRADITANQEVSLTEAKPKQELAASFRQAYGNTLKPHHGFLVKPIFSAAMSAAPYRKDFIAKLFGANPPSNAQADIEQWVAALEKRVGIIKAFMESPAAKW